MTNDIKKILGENTEKIEKKAGELWGEYSPYYANLEPWQRGLLIIILLSLLVFAIYYLTKPDKNITSKREAQIEERILRQMAFFKRLRE